MQINSFQHLLIPYDFSETAKVALRHASFLASRLKAKLSILNVMEDFSVEQVLHPSPKQQVNFADYKNHVLKKLEEETMQSRVDFGVSIGCYVQQGKIFGQVSDFVKKNGADLIVIGTHGVKGRDHFFMGSNAYKVVNNTHTPVLSVQKAATEYRYKRVVMPMDSSFHTREKIPYACIMAAAYGATLVVAGLMTHHDKESITKMHAILNQTKKFLDSHHIAHEIMEKDSKNLAQDTIQVAEEQNADLIVIMTEQERTFSGLFLGPYAQQLVSHSTIPVLSIPPKVSLVMADVSV